MKVVTVVGARPQFVKASALSPVLRERHVEYLVHTGQHYDDEMSRVFFDELGLPPPDRNLGVGSGPHAEQTARMLVGIAEVLEEQAPDWLLLYGDTNSTLAGAIAAAKLHVPIAHVEAGLRSADWTMPEEVNRVLVDRISDLLFCPSEIAMRNLALEGIVRGACLVGDVMAAAFERAAERARDRSVPAAGIDIHSEVFALATVHRADNTDDPGRLREILAGLGELSMPVIWPVHPRTRAALSRLGAATQMPPNVRFLAPLGYLDMVQLERSAALILTDSGGVQKEAYWAGVPCVTLRDTTEWVETVEAGWNRLAGADRERIARASASFEPPARRPTLYGDTACATRCVREMERGPGPRFRGGSGRAMPGPA